MLDKRSAKFFWQWWGGNPGPHLLPPSFSCPLVTSPHAELSSDWIGPHGGETAAAPAIGRRGMKPPPQLRYGWTEVLFLLCGA